MNKPLLTCSLLLNLVANSLSAQTSGNVIGSLQDGDLFFCVAEGSAMSDAIVDATKSEATTQYDHVAIFANIDGVPSIIEANPKHGVRACSLSEFMEDIPVIDGKKGVTVKRVSIPIDISAAIERARNLIGQPYDWSYRPDNGKVYCSELVYDCYLDADGAPIFKASPMNFRNADGEMPAFWTEVFANLGEEIPEGVPGTNPNDMSSAPILRPL